MDLPTPRQLECFVAAAEEQSFRLAAERCQLSQPSLSANVKNLEASLGVTLFDRKQKGLPLTTAGERLLPGARDVLARLKDMLHSASSLATPLAGELRFGVIPTIAPYVLPLALGSIRRAYPDLRLLIREEQTARLLELLAGGELDLLLLALEADGLEGFETHELWWDPFHLALPEGHPLADRERVSLADISAQEMLLLEDGHCLRDQSLTFCERAGAHELADFRASSLATLLEMVAGGIGVTLIPQVALDVEIRAGRGVTTVPLDAKARAGRTLGLVWRPGSIRRDEFLLFAEALDEGYPLAQDG